MPKGGGIDDGGKSGAGEEGMLEPPPPPLGVGPVQGGTLGANGAPEETPFSSPLAFMFEQRHGKLDVRSLHRLDIDDIVRNVDVDALHGVLENLTFCELRPSDLPTLTDVSIVKAFRALQLIAEYLLNVQNYLHREAAARKKHVDKLEGELDQSVEDAKVLCDDNDHLRRELRQKRRALATYEYVLAQHVPNAARVVASTAAGAEAFSPEAHRSGAAHVCKTCSKVFSSRHYLLKHCSRRGHQPFDEESTKGKSKEDEGATINSVTLLKLRDALAEMSVSEAVKAARETERKMYDDQLATLRAEHARHVERLEAEHMKQLTAVKSSHETELAKVKSKLEVMVDVRNDGSRSTAESARVRELEEAVRRLQEDSGEREEEAYLREQAILERSRRAQLRRVFRLGERRRMDRAFRRMYLDSRMTSGEVIVGEEKDNGDSDGEDDHRREEQNRKELEAAMEEIRALKASESKKKRRHVDDVPPLNEDELRALVQRYVAARETIPDHLRKLMAEIDAGVNASVDAHEGASTAATRSKKYSPFPKHDFLGSAHPHDNAALSDALRNAEHRVVQKLADLGVEASRQGIRPAEFEASSEILKQESENRGARHGERVDAAASLAAREAANEEGTLERRVAETRSARPPEASRDLLDSDAILAEALIPIADREAERASVGESSTHVEEEDEREDVSAQTAETTEIVGESSKQAELERTVQLLSRPHGEEEKEMEGPSAQEERTTEIVGESSKQIELERAVPLLSQINAVSTRNILELGDDIDDDASASAPVVDESKSPKRANPGVSAVPEPAHVSANTNAHSYASVLVANITSEKGAVKELEVRKGTQFDDLRQWDHVTSLTSSGEAEGLPESELEVEPEPEPESELEVEPEPESELEPTGA